MSIELRRYSPHIADGQDSVEGSFKQGGFLTGRKGLGTCAPRKELLQHRVCLTFLEVLDIPRDPWAEIIDTVNSEV
jgi:hypothetical protein